MDLTSLSGFLEGPENQAAVSILFSLLAVWTLIWKGLALYHASRLQQKLWFIIILIINFAGIVEILYLFYFSKHRISKTDLKNYWAKLKYINMSRIKNLLYSKL